MGDTDEMPYRALYRQWRPKTFSEMIGQTAIISTLKNQVMTDRIAHAYLFCGSRGTGKTSTAKILAKAINCEHPKDGDPCGECENCLRMERDESLDVIEIDAASNNGVDEIRELRDSVKYPPQFGKYKVYIIDEVHMLSTSAFNALLKTLEEPPAHIVFILATTEPQKLPETILSRCQRFDFGRLSVPEIQKRLSEAVSGSGQEVTDGALMLIARAAEGGMRDALSILDMCLGSHDKVDEDTVRAILGTNDRSFLFRYCDALADNDVGACFGMIAELMQNGKDPAVFTREIASHVRTLLMVKTCEGPKKNLSAEWTEEDLEDFIRQGERFTVTRLMKLMDLYMGLETEMRYASSPRLALENAALKSCLKTQEADVQALLDRIGELEKKVSELSEKGIAIRESKAESKKEKTTEDHTPKKPETSAPMREASTGIPAAGGGMPGAKELGKQLIDQLKKREPSMPGMLMKGEFTAVRDGVLIWQPAAGPAAEIYIKSLNMPQRKAAAEAILKELTGEEIAFQATAAKEGTATPSPGSMSDEQYLNTLYGTFGKEPVDVSE